VADEDISEETRMLAMDALARARAAPGTADIRGIERDALAGERSAMTPAEIRALAAKAVGQAQEIGILMTRLADLLESGPGGLHGC
jgi:hypothetical protein